MSGLFSRAKEKIASWTGGGGNKNADNSASSTPTQSKSLKSPSQNSLSNFGSPSPTDSNTNNNNTRDVVVSPVKLEQLDKILNTTAAVDLTALRTMCWCGVPDPARRFDAWCLLLRYVPPQVAASGAQTLLRKRNEYNMFVQQHHGVADWGELLDAQNNAGTGGSLTLPASVGGTSTFLSGVSLEDLNVMRQIRKDVPRTFGGVRMLQHARAQLLLERVLFIWAIRHPASGYVQGMNDILLPFLFVTLSKKISSDGDVHRLLNLTEADVKAVSGGLRDSDWLEVEADSYWLLSAFMSSVQSNFTFSQGGTHALVRRMQTIVALADPALNGFLSEAGIVFEEFAFRWMNCFLLRELPPALGVRLFDTYCAEEADNSGQRGGSGGGFCVFHVYVCAAMLIRWSERIQSCEEYVQLVQLLHNPPTTEFTEETIAELTAQAYVLTQQYSSRVDQAMKAAEDARSRTK